MKKRRTGKDRRTVIIGATRSRRTLNCRSRCWRRPCSCPRHELGRRKAGSTHLRAARRTVQPLFYLPKCWPLEIPKRVAAFPLGLFLAVPAELLALRRRERSDLTPDLRPGEACCRWPPNREGAHPPVNKARAVYKRPLQLVNAYHQAAISTAGSGGHSKRRSIRDSEVACAAPSFGAHCRRRAGKASLGGREQAAFRPARVVVNR